MDLHNCTLFTICLGIIKAIGTTSSVCLAIIIWFVNDNEVLEELYRLADWTVTITGLYICCAATNTSSKPQVRYPKIVSDYTVGILTVTGKEAGLIILFRKLSVLISYILITCHEELHAKYNLSHKGHTMEVVNFNYFWKRLLQWM